MRAFWARLTEGFRLEQLWGQFKSEAQAGYVLYSKDVDWEAIAREKSRFKRILLSRLGALSSHPDEAFAGAASAAGLRARCCWFSIRTCAGETNEVNFDFVGRGRADSFHAAGSGAGRPRDHEARSGNRPRNSAVAGSQRSRRIFPAWILRLPRARKIRWRAIITMRFCGRVPPAGAETPSLLVVVADVAGKSVPAALLMATFQSGLRALSGRLRPRRDCRWFGALRARAQSGGPPLHHRVSRGD